MSSPQSTVIHPSHSTAPAWFMWSLVAVAYVIAFFQRVAPQAIVDLLMADLNVGASEIGIVTAAYFYGYMAMQFPAGLIVDHGGVRCAVVSSLLISGIGTLWFAHASTMQAASVARILVALGDALIFAALIKVSAQWFPAKRFGVMSGLSQLCGYLGGLLATTPLAVMVSSIGWRNSFSACAYLVMGNLGLSASAGNLAGAIAQPLLGGILDHHWTGAWAQGARLYTIEGYTWLLLALAAVAACTIVGPLLIAEKGLWRDPA